MANPTIHPNIEQIVGDDWAIARHPQPSATTLVDDDLRHRVIHVALEQTALDWSQLPYDHCAGECFSRTRFNVRARPGCGDTMGFFGNLFGRNQRDIWSLIGEVETAVRNCVADFKDRTQLSNALIFPAGLSSEALRARTRHFSYQRVL
jgi:hypothetical protein